MRIKFNLLLCLFLGLHLVGCALAFYDSTDMELLEQVLGILRVANVVKRFGRVFSAVLDENLFAT